MSTLGADVERCSAFEQSSLREAIVGASCIASSVPTLAVLNTEYSYLFGSRSCRRRLKDDALDHPPHKLSLALARQCPAVIPERPERPCGARSKGEARRIWGGEAGRCRGVWLPDGRQSGGCNVVGAETLRTWESFGTDRNLCLNRLVRRWRRQWTRQLSGMKWAMRDERFGLARAARRCFEFGRGRSSDLAKTANA